jgi:hypothetical protein
MTEVNLLNSNDLAIDPVTILRSKEGNDTGNVEWLTNTVMWGPGSGIFVNLVVVHLITTWNILLADSVIHVGLDTTWSNAVDSDLLVTTVCF